VQKVNKKLEADKKEKLSIALRANLLKRKLFQKKINNKGKNI
jgi:hypothetical protein